MNYIRTISLYLRENTDKSNLYVIGSKNMYNNH